MKKYVYLFNEGNADMRELLGGKGANLAEMTNIGLPVPPGFTVSTEACIQYYEDGEKINKDILKQVYSAMEQLESNAGKKFGDTNAPLLVSVRSGARASMPGMMDTVLNLGMNDDVAEGIAALTGNERFAYDSYRRFIQMFSDVVMGVDKQKFDDILDLAKKSKGVSLDTELDAQDLREIVLDYKKLYKKEIGSKFPEGPREQLKEAIKAVFRSWNNARAISYRRMNDIPSSWGTAVNVQMMVFGNMGEDSGTGVAFTRNPSTGENKLYGEYLINAQGEDVVAGIRTPQPISTLADAMPGVYKQFEKIAELLEKHYSDMQDMEFTIEKGKLYMLQTRNGKRTAQAALKIAVDLYNEGRISKEEAILKIDAKQLDSLLHPVFTTDGLKSAVCIAEGLPASPGAASGRIYFSAEDAFAAASEGIKTILVRTETSPEDIDGMHSSEGVLTNRGGMTSHAAVVARGMGRCCVVGCGSVTIDEISKTMTTSDGTVYREGDYISIDGNTGKVYSGSVPTQEPQMTGDFATVMKWADEIRTMKIRTNADTPADAARAVEFGAEGIGLCRTEHMFFGEDRISAVREMILADNSEQRKRALEKLLPMQRNDFEEIFKVMAGRPVTIRLLDPPLHEFLPKNEQDIRALADEMFLTYEQICDRIDSLHEFNPMMGHRGCRLSVTYPEIAEMQTRAIIEAAIDASADPEIMIPLVCEKKELEYVKRIVVSTVEKVFNERRKKINYKVGTMIEVPRAALTADEIAKEAEFFSFGTNDLTQMTFGFSRDDSAKFLQAYYANSIFEFDPFQRLDTCGVGKLVSLAANLGRQTRPDIKLGICGEHGGDPSTIEFAYKVGLDYVSCSPYRVPIARLAAAQAKVKKEM